MTPDMISKPVLDLLNLLIDRYTEYFSWAKKSYSEKFSTYEEALVHAPVEYLWMANSLRSFAIRFELLEPEDFAYLSEMESDEHKEYYDYLDERCEIEKLDSFVKPIQFLFTMLTSFLNLFRQYAWRSNPINSPSECAERIRRSKEYYFMALSIFLVLKDLRIINPNNYPDVNTYVL